jgi:hypothetical protein
MPVQLDPDAFNSVEDTAVNESLAAFTDSLLDNQEPTMQATSNEELTTLQKTVYRLQQALGRQQPEAVVARRILSNVMVEWWSRSRPSEATGWQRFVPALARPAGRRSGHGRRQLAAALALSLVLLGAVALLFVGPEARALPGAVPNQPPFSLFIFVPVLLGGGVIWWFLSRRR